MNVTSSLDFHPLGHIRISLGDVNLSPGSGVHRMPLPITFNGTWLTSDEPHANTPALLVGTIWTELPGLRWLAGVEPQVVSVRRFPVGADLVASISDEQLIAVERARARGDVRLLLKIQATLLAPQGDAHPVADRDISVPVSRSRWLELLDQVGSEVGILVRVPSPLTDSALEAPPAASDEDAASLAQAVARLRQARAELRDGQWEHCVATCRRVLENIARLAPLSPAGSVFAVRHDERTQDDRWAAIFYDLKGMANAAHHDDEVTGGFTWERADAEAVLAMTAGAFRRFIS